MHRLKKYNDECFSRLVKHLREYSSEDDIETLHKIRVEIKKIKAVIQLINTHVKGFHAHKTFIPLRDIFRATGKIREPELLYELLLSHHVEIKNVHVPDEEKQASLSRRFRKKIPTFIQTILHQKAIIDKRIRKISKSQIRSYLKDKKESLRLQFRGSWSGPSLHKARKLTKEILYVGAIQRKTGKASGDFFDKLQEMIGQWHDRQLLLPILVKYKSPEIQRLRLESIASVGQIKKFVRHHYDVGSQLDK